MRFRENLVGRVLFPVSNALYNRRGIYSAYQKLLVAECMDAEKKAEFQWRKLQRLLHFAETYVPFYRNRFQEMGFSAADVQSIEDYRQLAPVERQDVIDYHHEMVDRRKRGYVEEADLSPRGPGDPIAGALFRRNQMIRNTSSGSTGAPTTFYENGRRTALNWALDWRHRAWFGLAPGAAEARMLRGSRDLERKSWLPDARELLWNQLMLPGTNLTDLDCAACVEELLRFRPRILWGFTSAWVALAEHIRRHDSDLGSWHPELVLTWAAPLYDHERAILSDVFRCPISNNYSARETGHIAAECPEGRFHIHEEHVLLEQDGDGDANVSSELLCTTLDVTVMPFIRYRMGDLGRIVPSSCPCGRTLPVLDQFLGRTGEVFHTRDGRVIAPNFWCRTFMDPALGGKVVRFQIVYGAQKDIQIRIVRGSMYDQLAEFALLERVKTSLGGATEVRLVYVERIEPHVSGKYQMVVWEDENQQDET